MGKRRQEQIKRAIAAHQLKVPYGHRHYHIITSPTDDSERHWLAGYLEGEAAFIMKKFVIRGKRYHYPAIEVNSTDPDVVERVQSIWQTRYGACVNINFRQPTYPGSKRVYRVEANNIYARSIMEHLHPLLGQRRQARIHCLLNEV